MEGTRWSLRCATACSHCGGSTATVKALLVLLQFDLTIAPAVTQAAVQRAKDAVLKAVLQLARGITVESRVFTVEALLGESTWP